MDRPKRRIVISVARNGDMTFIDNPRLTALVDANARVQRASHVVPVGWLKRVAFQALRLLFGEAGRVSEWTRKWQGPWLADMKPSTGPVLGPFPHRQHALDAEIEWLNRHYLTKT